MTTKSAAKIADEVGIPERTAQRILCEQRILHTPGKGYVVQDAVRAIVNHYRTAAERLDASTAEDRARKARAEADLAELDVARRLGRLCLIEDAKQFWSGARIEIRRTIERAEYLSESQRKRLLTELADLHPTPPEPDN